MKIVLWSTSYLPLIGGLEVFVHSLALQLKKTGHEVIVICDGKEFAEVSLEGIDIYHFPFVTTLYRFDLNMIKKILDRICALLDAFSPDVINVHGWFEGFCFYQTRVLEKKKSPLCITIHGLLEQQDYRTASCLKLWSLARSINTVSKALIESLEEQKHFHPFLHVIYNGLVIPSDPIVPLSFKAPQLLMVGRLTEEKCFNIAFHAMDILRKIRPDMTLRLVGGGPLYQELLDLKQSLQLDPWIEMTNFVPPDQVRHYIDEASLILVPSSYESFSLVALESALRARPVIASSVCGLKEVVSCGKTGVLIEPKNPVALFKAIDTLLSAPEQMTQMGWNGYQRATQLFSIETTAKNYLDMYHQIL